MTRGSTESACLDAKMQLDGLKSQTGWMKPPRCCHGISGFLIASQWNSEVSDVSDSMQDEEADVEEDDVVIA